MTTMLPPWSSVAVDANGPEPSGSAADVRNHRKAHVARAYRLFGAFGWGTLGDGHISARDPERPDCFWLLRYGVPFNQARAEDLVLVGPGGEVVEGSGAINMTAYYIHAPIHDARSDVVCAAHTHTAYGTPWAATAEQFQMICQEATAFFDDHAVFEGEEVQVSDTDTGRRIAEALGGRKAVLLRNHGPLTVGRSVEEAIGWFLMMERVAEVHIKTQRPRPISDEAARVARAEIGAVASALSVYAYATASKLGPEGLA